MIYRVAPWLLMAAVLLTAVPCELSEQRPATPLPVLDGTQACLTEPGSSEPTGTSIPVDCLCLCLCLCQSGHTTPALARHTLIPFEGSGKHPIPGQLIPTSEPLGSLFHPPRVV